MNMCKRNGFVLAVLLVLLTRGLDAAIAGPCVNYEQFSGLDGMLSELNIEFVITVERGEKFICWDPEDDARVQAIRDRAFGRIPDSTALILPDQDRGLFVKELNARGIPHQQYTFAGRLVVDWRDEDDDEAAKALLNAIGFDIVRHRQESLKAIRDTGR